MYQYVLGRPELGNYHVEKTFIKECIRVLSFELKFWSHTRQASLCKPSSFSYLPVSQKESKNIVTKNPLKWSVQMLCEEYCVCSLMQHLSV